jgi:hypothetical protein
MSVRCKFERSLLSHDEYETIRPDRLSPCVEPRISFLIRLTWETWDPWCKFSRNFRAPITTQAGLRRCAEADALKFSWLDVIDRGMVREALRYVLFGLLSYEAARAPY